VKGTIRTVATNLLEGGIFVMAVLFLMLGSVRGGLVVAAAIPLSMLCAFIDMVRAGVSGNLMSLGAIDFGLIVDGAVVIVENVFRVMAERHSRGQPHEEAVREAAAEVAHPVAFAVAIIMIVYIPILTLTGVEMSDVFIRLKPRAQWRYRSKEELVSAMAKVLDRTIPGVAIAFSQPIELRVAELIAGVRGDVAIRVSRP
jgi:Cu/Ag efflux pump CusA